METHHLDGILSYPQSGCLKFPWTFTSISDSGLRTARRCLLFFTSGYWITQENTPQTARSDPWWGSQERAIQLCIALRSVHGLLHWSRIEESFLNDQASKAVVTKMMSPVVCKMFWLDANSHNSRIFPYWKWLLPAVHIIPNQVMRHELQ